MTTTTMDRLFYEGGLTTSYTPLAPEVVSELLAKHYGVSGQLHPLATEKDTTYRVAADGVSYLVKVSPPDEPVPVVLCQTDAIDWVERTDPSVPVQRVLRSRSGRNHEVLTGPDGEHQGVLRLYEFIPGSMLGEGTPTPAQLRKTGEMLARVDAALAGFSHPGTERALVWNIGNFPVMRPLLEYEADDSRRALAEEIFGLYERLVVPVLGELPQQVIHGDFSAYNAIIDEQSPDYIAGVIDFGDIQHGPTIFDPAVLLANHVLPAPADPWEHARHLLAGYTGLHPLSGVERRALAVATIARMAMRALITNWRIAHVPERAAYLSGHARDDWQRIENVMNFGVAESIAALGGDAVG